MPFCCCDNKLKHVDTFNPRKVDVQSQDGLWLKGTVLSIDQKNMQIEVKVDEKNLTWTLSNEEIKYKIDDVGTFTGIIYLFITFIHLFIHLFI